MPPWAIASQQRPQRFRQSLRLALGSRQRFAEQLARQQLDVLGEHAEHQLHQEVGRLVGLDAAQPHAIGELAKVLGRLLGDAARRQPRLERFRLGEEPAERFQVLRFGQTRQVEVVNLLGRAGEVGVQLEAVQVADDEERRASACFTFS